MSSRGSRARHVHVMSLNLLTSRTSPLRALYLYQTADESALEKTEPLSLRYAQLSTSTSSQSLKNILKPPDISYDQYFCNDLHWNSETVNAFPQMLIWRKKVPVVLE